MGDFFSQGQIQSQKQSQIQSMSQQQIHALKILAMDTKDLLNEISEATENNPVLQIDDELFDEGYAKRKTNRTEEKKASDAYQKILEQKEDSRESLSEHLLHQLHMERYIETEIGICEKLIYNLDSQGHHILEPATLLDKKNPKETQSLLMECIKKVQSLDPVGCCTKNIEESLFVQGSLNQNADNLSIFILEGHLDFINPPTPSKALKKIKSYQQERKNLFGLSEKELFYLNLEIDEDMVQKSIDFIKTLNPFPASAFSSEETQMISPDIYVKEISEKDLSVDSSNKDKLREQGILKIENRFWKIQIKNKSIPEVSIAPDFLNTSTLKKDLQENVKSAKDFIEMLKNRKETIEKSAWEIVTTQHNFFEMGEGHLVPFRLKDLAEKVGVAESTISRMANGKYLQYNGSIYPLKYFFENSVAQSNTADGDSENQNISRDKIQFEIKQILDEHKDDKKKLSDQKICDLLEKKGIKIARRTVAKYRGQLNIESSYDR